jgi:hypothetical protein
MSVPRIALRVAKAATNSLKLLGVDTKHFSRISMLRGRSSAGLAARVSEPILFFQNGHESNYAACNYLVPRGLGVSL